MFFCDCSRLQGDEESELSPPRKGDKEIVSTRMIPCKGALREIHLRESEESNVGVWNVVIPRVLQGIEDMRATIEKLTKMQVRDTVIIAGVILVSVLTNFSCTLAEWVVHLVP